MGAHPHVVCVGLATVDVIQRVDRVPGVDEKVQALSMETAAGGPATNAAVTAAALGADVTLVTAVGAHPLGELIRADLAACGVTLRDAAPSTTAPPPVSSVAVLVDTGQRTIVSRNAGDVAVGVPEGFDDLVADADVVLVDGHHPALARAAARAAARAGRPVVVDAGSWKPVLAEVIPHATVVACSAAFRHPGAGAAGDAATASAVQATGVRHIAVTHGPDPVRWWSTSGHDAGGHDSGRHGELAVPAVRAVDTSGAGDAFHGALAVAIADDPGVTDLVAALRQAIAVAGIRVGYAGPRAWLHDPRLPPRRRGQVVVRSQPPSM